ncbi:unnamed protein product [Lampetra planeri]
MLLHHGLYSGGGKVKGNRGGALLQQDTVRTSLAPLHECQEGYFARKIGTPWETDERLGYDVVRKDGDIDCSLAHIWTKSLKHDVQSFSPRAGSFLLLQHVE